MGSEMTAVDHLRYQTRARVVSGWASVLLAAKVGLTGAVVLVFVAPTDDTPTPGRTLLACAIGVVGLSLVALGLTSLLDRPVTEIDLGSKVLVKRWTLFGRVTRTVRVSLNECTAVRIRRETTDTEQVRKKRYTYFVTLACSNPDLDESRIDLQEHRKHRKAHAVAESLAAKVGLPLADPYESC
jgi:hypothetical protein